MMKPISERRLRDLLVELHRLTDLQAREAVDAIIGKSAERIDVSYPPGSKLSTEEQAELRALRLSQTAESGLKKVIVDAVAAVIFHQFCMIDAVGDPEKHNFDVWLGATLAEPVEEDTLMLHDEWLDSYWAYEE